MKAIVLLLAVPYSLDHMQLIYLQTPDRYSCEGLFWPARLKQPKLGAVLVHGWTFWFDPRDRSRGFCGKLFATIAERLSESGIPAVLAMNRGFHAPEFFNDCAVDVQANIDFLVAQGCEEILIIGHSLGGAKCAYYAAEVGHPRLRGVVLLSAIPSTYNFAGKESLIEEAHGKVAEAHVPTILPFTEGQTVALHEPNALIRSFQSAYQGTTLDAAAKIMLPILSLAAEGEWSWFQEVCKGIKGAAHSSATVDAQIIAGARDHNYSGHEEDAARRILAWMRQVGLDSGG